MLFRSLRPDPALILYEYPFNERIRTLLRLEDLFERLYFFAAHEHAFEHHAALVTLFEILDRLPPPNPGFLADIERAQSEDLLDG